MLRINYKRAVVVLFALLVSSCATLKQNIQNPEVSLVSIEPAPASSLLEQNFKVRLKVLNPNSITLPVKGLTYSLSLNGHKLVSGVTSDISSLPAYGEAPLDLIAGINLLSGARFLADLLQSGGQALDYRLETRLDIGSLLPDITLVDEGSIALSQ